MAFNLALKVAILESGKRQIVIAAKAGIDNSRLSKIVNGHMAANELERRALAKVLHRPVSDLFPEVAA